MADFAKVALFSILLAFSMEDSVAVNVQKLRSGRSATWEEHIRQPRESSDPCDSDWYVDTASCNGMDYYTQYDKLKRRASGFLADVESQGNCGSCWAFAASHTFSDYRNLKAKAKLPTISTEYTLHCVPSGTENGCCGGQPGRAMKHFTETGTVNVCCLGYSRANYPPNNILRNLNAKIEYKKAHPLTCPAKCNDNSIYTPEETTLAANYYHDGVPDSLIMSVLNTTGPIAVTLQVTLQVHGDLSFRYKCGVYCSNNRGGGEKNEQRHAVEIVDWGELPSGTRFWVIKNSWGPDWGENGYLRIRMGDLKIGASGYPVSIPRGPDEAMELPSRSFAASDVRADMNTCNPSSMTDLDNILIVSAAKYGLDHLMDQNLFLCPSRSLATRVTYTSVCSAELQVVEGVLLNMNVQSRVEGCGEDYTNAVSNMEVIINLDSNFTLTEYEITFNAPCSGTAIQGSLILTALLVVTVLVCR